MIKKNILGIFKNIKKLKFQNLVFYVVFHSLAFFLLRNVCKA